MKTKCYLCVACFLLAGLFIQRANAQANTELSNLISPTRVNQSLLPNTDNIRNLGSANRSWKDLYVDGAVYLGGARFLAYKTGTGTGNTAVGSNVLNANTSGFSNTGTGFNALLSNTAGFHNTANGGSALYSNTIGNYNSALGHKALYSNTSGTFNTANGSYALYSNTTGNYNTATGYTALNFNTGDYNTANGYEALHSNTFGEANTANGSYALYSNTNGNYNTANGYKALYSNTGADYNTATGNFALYSNTGGDNTATGLNALYSNTTGNDNTANGWSAGSFNDNNNFCTFIGNDADQNVTTDFINSTALGYISRITASNQVRIGNSSVTSIGGYEPWTNLSDARFKKNVKENVPGLTFINQLHAVTYTMDVTRLRNFLGEDRLDEITTAEGKTVREKNHEAEALIQKGIQEKEKIIRTGFVAQEVEEVAKRIGYDFSGVDKPANEHTPYGLRYSEFVVPLVKAVQELSQQNEDLKKENQELKTRLDKLEAAVFQSSSANIILRTSARLEQNIPNPFNHTTIINYTLPQISRSAKIIITDKNGKMLKEVRVSGSGKGSINVNVATLSSGSYQYSLYIDGRLIDTKQMILQK